MELKFVRFTNIVEHGHAALPYQDELLFFVGVEPTDEDVRTHAPVEQHCGDRDVGYVRLQVRSARGCHLYRYLFHQEQDYGNVVGREAPEGILFPAYFAQVEAVRVDVFKPAEFPLVNQFLEANNGRVKLQELIDQGELGRLEY